MNDTEKQFTDVVSVAQTLLRKQKDKGDITPLVIKEKVMLAAGMLAGDLDEPFDVERAINELVRRFSHWIGKDSSLQDDEGHIQWLNAVRKKDWRYWQRYQTFLEKKMSVEVVGALDESTDNILGRLEDPTRSGVGQVRSGWRACAARQDGELHRARLQGSRCWLQNHHRSGRPSQQPEGADTDSA